MQDRYGNELKIGDYVCYISPNASSTDIWIGTIVGFTPKNIRVIGLNKDFKKLKDSHLRHPNQVILYTDQIRSIIDKFPEKFI